MPKIGVGRIVHFRVPAEDVTNGGNVVPAMVTQVFPNADGSVDHANLVVFRPFGDVKHYGSVLEATDDITERRWFWPPRD